ncbi:hypothetical protein JNJ66_03245 [Candidatus Saccharibacteria bacterium]|nr:hypothetical protein [Candidatus Saccharibacteria bacterium]
MYLPLGFTPNLTFSTALARLRELRGVPDELLPEVWQTVGNEVRFWQLVNMAYSRTQATPPVSTGAELLRIAARFYAAGIRDTTGTLRKHVAEVLQEISLVRRAHQFAASLPAGSDSYRERATGLMEFVLAQTPLPPSTSPDRWAASIVSLDHEIARWRNGEAANPEYVAECLQSLLLLPEDIGLTQEEFERWLNEDCDEQEGEPATSTP